MKNFLINKFVGKNINPSDMNTRKKCGILSGVVGIICNLILFFVKFIIGIITGSIAATADAFNNLSDAGSSIITFICFKMASNPADKDHPFGHGRIEYICGIIISITIIITGLGFVKSSIENIFSPEEVSINTVSLIILCGSIIIKLWLGFFNNKLSVLINSSAMKATSNDSFTDSIATFTVISSGILTKFFNFYLDPYAGLVVSCFIIYTGFKTLKEALSPLVGQPPEPRIVKNIENVIKFYPIIENIDEIMVHNYGQSWSVVSFRAKIIIKKENNDIFAINEMINEIENEISKENNCSTIIKIDPIQKDTK